MTAWTSDELTRIGTAEELRITLLRRDGTPRNPVTVWVARLGDDLYVTLRERSIGRLVPRNAGAPRRPHPGRQHR
jgi:hypothetical protein